MASMFDQYNQQVQKGPENDYSQALGLVAPKPSGSTTWANYQGGGGDAGKEGQEIGQAAKGLFASGGGDAGAQLGGAFGASMGQTASSPSSQIPSGMGGANMGASAGAQTPMAPGAAMSMVAPKSSSQPQWANYGGGSGGGGGGGDMSSVASIAMAFI